MSNEAKWAVGLVACLVVVCLCIGAFTVLGGLSLFMVRTATSQEQPPVFEWNYEATVEVGKPAPVEPTRRSPAATPTPRPLDATQEPAGDGAAQNLQRLIDEIVPPNEPHDLAYRLQGKTGIPETVDGPSEPLQVGAKETFWAINDDSRKQFQVNATLQYVTDHLYFFIEDGVRYNRRDLERLSETFENQIYPTNREFFGSEWTPGVDNDPHLYVLYARGLGRTIAGYYSPMDQLHPDVNQYSNAHEMFFMSADNVGLGEPSVYGTMAHEFQHMIHWYRDRNETSWINEGFSVLAELLNGFDVGGFDYMYVSQPDIQLTYWPSSEAAPHYGQSFMYVAYFLDRFGEEATQAVVGHEDNSMDSIEAVLRELNITDPSTGEPVTADDFFADWVITTYLNNARVGDGRYVYKSHRYAPKAGDTEAVTTCPAGWETRNVSQYGVDYIKVGCSGSHTLEFEGATEVSLLPVAPYDGSYAFWSNRGDASNMTLTREFDFTGVSAPLTLTYMTWYDLEEDYDYVYLEVSEDGEQWEFIETPSGTDTNPVGNNYGWGYNAGSRGGWVEETINISHLAGKKVFLRFEYVTDTAVNGEGLMVDNISILETDYFEGFEKDDGGWDGQGFVRVSNDLPQAFRVSLIVQGRETSVQYVELDDQQKASIQLDLNRSQNAVLVVSGVTRFTNQKAIYRFRLR